MMAVDDNKNDNYNKIQWTKREIPMSSFSLTRSSSSCSSNTTTTTNSNYNNNNNNGVIDDEDDEEKQEQQQGDPKKQEEKQQYLLIANNPSVNLPDGIEYRTGFLSEKEERDILNELLELEDEHNETRRTDYVWEGFDQRRRVKRFQLQVHHHDHNDNVQPPEYDGNNNNTSGNNDDDINNGVVLPIAPTGLMKLRDRIRRFTGHDPRTVAVEEYPVNSKSWYDRRRSDFQVSNHAVSTYETTCCCTSSTSTSTATTCLCMVGQIPLKKSVIQHWNRPQSKFRGARNKKTKGNHPQFKLLSPNHWADIRIDRGALLVRTGECLHHWRSRYVASIPNNNIVGGGSTTATGSDMILMLKFYTLVDGTASSSSGSLVSSRVPRNNTPSGLEDDDERDEDDDDSGDDLDDFGYVPSKNKNSNEIAMPPLRNLLTIIITTSPVKSNPSTLLLENAMKTFINGGNEFAYECRKVIVCDGYRTKTDDGSNNVTRKYTNPKQAMRNGVVTSEQAENYREFKLALKELCRGANINNSDDADADLPNDNDVDDEKKKKKNSLFCNATVEELDTRQGYGYALRHALRHCVKTPYVCVVQHDRTFMRPTPVYETLRTMYNNPQVKYVGMSMRSNLLYRDIFLSKYGRKYSEQHRNMVLRPPQLLVDPAKYGPDSESTRLMDYSKLNSEKHKNNILLFAETYRTSSQYLEEQDRLLQRQDMQQSPQGCKVPSLTREEEGGEHLHQLTLTPTLFWYDNVHIAETEHYRDFIFDERYKMVARGGFVEDKLSPVIKRTVERLGLRDGHSRFGCFLLDDHSGMFFTGHLDGGSYLTPEALRQKVIDSKMKNGKKKL